MPEQDILFLLSGDAAGAIDAITALIDVVTKLDSALQGLASSLSVLNEVEAALAALGADSGAVIGTADALTTLADASTTTSGTLQQLVLIEDAVATSATTVGDALTTASSQVVAAGDAIVVAADASQVSVDNLAVASGNATRSMAEMASSIGLTAEEFTILAAADASAGTGMVDFLNGAGEATVILDALGKGANADAVALDELDAVFAAMMVALSDDATMIASVNDALNLMGEAGVTADTALTLLEQACITLGTSFTDVLVGVQDLNAALDASTPAIDTFASSFTAAELSAGLFGQTLSTIPSEIAAVAASMDGMVAATDAVTAASSTKNTVLKEQTAATQADAYMILVLLQFLLQAVGGFVAMGTSAQDSIAKLSGLADQSLAGASGLSRLNGVVSALEADSIKFGIGLTAASDGLYHIMSSGFKTSDALLILKSSMEATSATGAKMEDVSTAITSILNSYNLKAKDAALITNEMMASVTAGNMKMPEYAKAIGNLASVASQTGFSFVEATSALSEFTQINGRTRQDAQNLANTFVVLGTRAADIAKVAKGLGIGFDEVHFKSLGLIDKLRYLSEIAGGDNTVAFRKLLLNATAARTAFMELANGGQNLATVMTSVAGNTTALDIAFSENEKTITASLNHMSAASSVFAYQMVVLATPTVTAFLSGLSSVMSVLTSHMDVLIPVVATLAVAIGGLLVTALGMMIDMMMPAVMISLSFFGPLALLVGIIVLVVQSLQRLASVSPPVAAAFSALGNQISTIGAFLGGIFNANVSKAGGLLQQLGAWAMQNVVPALALIVLNLTIFAQDILTNVVPAVQHFMTSMQPTASFITGTLIPAIGNFITSALHIAVIISGNIVPIFQTLGNIIKTVAPIIAAIGIAFAAVQLGTFLSGVSTVVAILSVGLLPALGSIISALALTAATAIIAAAPFIAVGIGIAALALGFIHVVQTSAPLQAMFRAIWSNALNLWNVLKASLMPVFQQLWTTLQAQLIPAWQQLVAALQPAMPVLEFLGKVVGAIIVVAFIALIGVLAGVIGAIGQFLRGIIQIVGGLIGMFAGIMSLALNFIHWLVALFTGNKADQERIWKEMGANIQLIWHSFLSLLEGVARATLGAIAAFIFGFINSVINFFKHLAAQVVGHSIWPDMFNSMLSFFTGWVSNILSAIGTWVSSVVTWFVNLGTQALAAWTRMTTTIWSALVSWTVNILLAIGNWELSVIMWFLKLGTQAVTAMQNAWTNLTGAVAAGIAIVIGKVTGFVSQIGGIFTGLISSAINWGSGLMQGFATGVRNAAGAVIGAATWVAGQVAALLHHSTPDTGPLAGDDKWMPDFGDMLASGLNDQVAKVGRAASNMAMSVQMAAPSPGDVARYSSPATSTAQADPAVLQVLQAILAELKNQGGGSGNNSMVIGHGIPNSALGAVTPSFGGGGSAVSQAHERYQQLNVLAGIAFENGVRGASTGLGV